MVYTVTSDSATKISESSGTIQNHSRDWDIEISNSADFTDEILLYPRHNYSFNNMDVYLRCAEQGMSAEVFVVPFSVDVKGGGDSSSAVIGSDSDALKAVSFTDNSLKFFTSIDTDTTPAFSFDISAEQFVDQTYTDFVHNFLFSAILYPGATNPNLNGKPVFVLALKTKNNDGTLSDISYKFFDMSTLVDTYLASDTSVSVSNYKMKVNISPDAGNALQLKNNGLYSINSGGFVPILEVKTNSDRVVTVTIDSDTLTPNSSDNNVLTYILPKFGSYHVTALNLNDDVMVDEVVEVDVVKKYKVNAGFRLFGYRIKQSEADPYERVEYLFDAVGMKPAHMVFDTDTNTAGTDSDTSYFDYGDWQNVWFVKNNKPCMLKYDGTVDYYLNPDDYTKKEDGTASDVANTSYEGNAMAQFPTVWFKRYTEGDYVYELISDIQLDDDFHAYAHTDANGTIKPYFFVAMFPSSGNSSQLRSLFSDSPPSLNYNQAYSAAVANGSGWYLLPWMNHNYLRSAFILTTKSTSRLSDFTFLHIQSCNKTWAPVLGIRNNNSGKFIVKLTPQNGGYSLTDNTYFTDTNISLNPTNAFVSSVNFSRFGHLPISLEGSDSTFYCADYYAGGVTSQNNYFHTGLGYRLFEASTQIHINNMRTEALTFSRLAFV